MVISRQPPHSAKEFDRISEMPNAVRDIDLEELTYGTNPGGKFQLLIGSIWESRFPSTSRKRIREVI